MKIFVATRRAGIEHKIRVWNLGGFIETEVTNNIEPELANKLEAVLEFQAV